MEESTYISPSHGQSESHREAVLTLMARKHVLSIEELLRGLPYMRWCELFSIVGLCIDEGIFVLEKRGMEFEVRMREADGCHPESLNVQPLFGLKHKDLGSPGSRHLTHS